MILWVLEGPVLCPTGPAPSGFLQGSLRAMRKRPSPFLCGSLALSNVRETTAQLRLLSPGCPVMGLPQQSCPSESTLKLGPRKSGAVCPVGRGPEPPAEAWYTPCGFRGFPWCPGGSEGGTWGKRGSPSELSGWPDMGSWCVRQSCASLPWRGTGHPSGGRRDDPSGLGWTLSAFKTHDWRLPNGCALF